MNVRFSKLSQITIDDNRYYIYYDLRVLFDEMGN